MFLSGYSQKNFICLCFRFCIRHFIYLTLALLSPQILAAEIVLILQNGDRISGELLSETPTQLQVKTVYSALLLIDKSQISQQQVPITAVQVSVKSNSTAAVVSKNPAAETIALHQPWQLEVDVSASTRRGKEQAESISAISHWELRDADWRYSTKAEFDYEIKANVRKAHKYTLNPGIDYFYSEHMFGRTKLDFSYDYLASDYKNIDISVGPGFSFFKDRDELRLELMALFGVKKAYFRGDDFLLALLGQNDQISFRFGSLDYDYQYQPSATALEWYAKGSVLKMLDQPIQLLDFKYEWHNELGARYWLTDKIRISWSIQHDWTSIDLILTDGSVRPLDVKDIRQKLSVGASF